MKTFMKASSRFFGRSFLVIAILAWALASCSAPLIAPIAFVRGKFSDTIELYLGAWGGQLLLISQSQCLLVLVVPLKLTPCMRSVCPGCVNVSNQLNCPSPQFGYAVSLSNFPGKTSDGDSPVSANLTYGLVLMPLSE